jgi:hypothetical protein
MRKTLPDLRKELSEKLEGIEAKDKDFLALKWDMFQPKALMIMANFCYN